MDLGRSIKNQTKGFFAFDCKVSTVIPELAKIRFMGKMNKKRSKIL